MRNCADLVSNPEPWAVRYHSDSRRRRVDINFGSRLSTRVAVTEESSHQVTDRWLCDVECLPRMSSGKLCKLARILS